MDQLSSLKQANAKLADENRVMQEMGGMAGGGVGMLPQMSGMGGKNMMGSMGTANAMSFAGRQQMGFSRANGGLGFAGAGMMMDAMSGQNYMSPRPPGGRGGRGSGRRGRRRGDDY